MIDRVIDYIIDWLSEYCEMANMKGFVIGVSGGIDSAVVSTLCAMTEFSIQLLDLPISKDSSALTTKHINWLEKYFDNVKSKKIPLTNVFHAFQKASPVDYFQTDLGMANIQARIRMIMLYEIASHYNMLVVGTGNKVEDFGIGFYTKYGDGGVDISPIGDLMKSDVYTIANYLGIIEEIQKAPPTDGLWEDGRTDEDQIGATYDELEWAMKHEAEYHYTNVQYWTNRQKEVYNIYNDFQMKNNHKMNSIPICTIPDDLKEQIISADESHGNILL